jgi:hypothetical protein
VAIERRKGGEMPEGKWDSLLDHSKGEEKDIPNCRDN